MRNNSAPTLGIYSVLDRLPWPRSYIGRILFVCFIGTHIPLIAFCVTAIVLSGAAGPQIWLQVFVLLVATLIATGITLACVYGMMAPIKLAAASLKAYRERRTLPSLPRHFTDEAGQMLAQVQDTLEDLDTAIHDLARAADTDALTAIGNRRWLMSKSAEQFNRARRSGAPLSIILFDLDRFKSINDLHGHAMGDAVLIGVSRFVKNAVSTSALFARSGGEEFCIVLPDTMLSAAAEIARMLQADMSEKAFASLETGTVTASFGVASAQPDDADTGALFARADDLLYRAKNEGRNRVVG